MQQELWFRVLKSFARKLREYADIRFMDPYSYDPDDPAGVILIVPKKQEWYFKLKEILNGENNA